MEEVQGKPKGVSHCFGNSNEEGNVLKQLLLRDWRQSKRNSMSLGGGRPKVMSMIFLKKALSSTLPFMQSSHMHNIPLQ